MPLFFIPGVKPSSTKKMSTKKARKPSFPLARLPAEIVLQVFTHFTDHDDVICLRMASRFFDTVYRNSPQTILKGTMDQLAGSADTLRLAAMAIESSQVDSRNESAVGAFLDRYIENGDVPTSFFVKGNLTPLGAMMAATKNIASLKMNNTQRAIQSLLRVEIAKNLFHDRLPNLKVNFIAPFPALEKRFWQSHSERDIEDLLLSRDMLSSALREALNSAYDCPSGQYCRCRDMPLSPVELKMWIGMSQAVGLVPLAIWAKYSTVIDIPFNPYTRDNQSHRALVDYQIQFLGHPDSDDEEFPDSIIEIALEAVRS
ncbi:hypothetical protein F4809DRAFT_646159 [Biscogniauxia mediterranea]|nr:hypothetical protein F4809DRAFT_646159 [Biscogniauxia mediterranea]